MKSFLSRLPVWAKVIAIFLAVVVIRNIVVGPAKVDIPVQAPERNAGQLAFGDRLKHYAEVDGHVLVAYKATEISRRALEIDIRTFMKRLANEKRTNWNEVTISAYGDRRDQYGKTFEQVAYTITFQRTEVEKVVDWNLAKIDQVGKVEFIDPLVK